MDTAGRQTLDEIDVRFVHLPEELARIRRQRLDIPTLPLGEDRVERQRRLARPRQSGEDDQRVAGQVEVDTAQVVLARTLDDQALSHPVPFYVFLQFMAGSPEPPQTSRSMLCRPTDNLPCRFAEPVGSGTMTVIADQYTGHVDPGTGARRTLPAASVVKVSVGPMDNNAYLVTCSQTGQSLLIDAANDAETLLEVIGAHAPQLR
jgi:hypothetical protein